MKHTRSIMSITMATIMLVSLCAVCASTSVSAASNSSKASVQATPSLVGSPIAAGTGPAACVLNGSTIGYVFVKGYDNALWYRKWDLSTDTWWQDWVSLGGGLTSSPCAVSRSAGNLDVYVRGTNGAVYDRLYDSYSGWSAWYNLGGQVAPGTGPAASGWAGRADVFVEGTNGALYQKTWTGGSGWVNLGGKLTSSPAATTFMTDIDVFVRGTNGAVYGTTLFRGGGPSGWQNFGGSVAAGTGPAVCAWGTPTNYREDVFVQGTNGALYDRTKVYGSEWSGWTSLGGGLSASPTAATSTYWGAVDITVFARGTNGMLYHKEYYYGSYGSYWHPWDGGYDGPSPS